jgi:hypothetical protein
LDKVQTAPLDRVASAMVGAVFPSAGAEIMAIAIMISTFGCINGMVLGGCARLLRHGGGQPVLQGGKEAE